MEKVTGLNDWYFTLNVFFLNQQAAYLLHGGRYYIKVLHAEYNYIEKKKYIFPPYEKEVVKRRGKRKESPVKTGPDEMYDRFCSGEGRGESE